MLIKGTPFVHLVNQFRIAWFRGSYGSGKTAMCFYLAYELIKSGKYRYLLSNSRSAWTDDPRKIMIRDERFIDTILILDEGGLFLRTGKDAEKFMIGLRKLNACVLIPSILPPSSRVRFLTVQRVLNGYNFGLPVWWYEYYLNLGGIREKDWFLFVKPDKIYGIYDTLDYPTDDLQLSDWMYFYMSKIKDGQPDWANWGYPPKRLPVGADGGVDEVGRDVEDVLEATSDLQETISFHARSYTSKKR